MTPHPPECSCPGPGREPTIAAWIISATIERAAARRGGPALEGPGSFVFTTFHMYSDHSLPRMLLYLIQTIAAISGPEWRPTPEQLPLMDVPESVREPALEAFVSTVGLLESCQDIVTLDDARDAVTAIGHVIYGGDSSIAGYWVSSLLIDMCLQSLRTLSRLELFTWTNLVDREFASDQPGPVSLPPAATAVHLSRLVQATADGGLESVQAAWDAINEDLQVTGVIVALVDEIAARTRPGTGVTAWKLVDGMPTGVVDAATSTSEEELPLRVAARWVTDRANGIPFHPQAEFDAVDDGVLPQIALTLGHSFATIQLSDHRNCSHHDFLGEPL